MPDLTQLDPNDPALKPPQAPPPGWQPPGASPTPPQPSGGAVETYLRESGAYTDPAEINYQRSAAEAERTKIEGQEAGAVDRNMHRREQLLARPIGAPPDPKLRDIPQRPQLQYQDAMKTFQSPAVLLATLGSLFTRRPAVNALTAGAEAIKGYMEGDAAKIEREEKNWKNSVEQVVKQNEVELEKYNAQWKRTNLSVTERAAQIQGLAAANQDQVLLAAIRSGHPERVEQIFAARQAANDRLAQTIVGIKGREDLAQAGLFNDEDAKLRAGQALAGDYQAAFKGLGTGLQGSENIKKITAAIRELRPNISSEELGRILSAANASYGGVKAAERTLTVREQNLRLIENEIVQASQPALKASEAVPRGRFVPLNKLIQDGKVITSNENYKELATRSLGLAEYYARSMNPTGVMRNEDRELALKILNTADSPATYKVAVNTIIDMIRNNKRAAEITKSELGASVGSAPGGPGIVGSPPPQGNSAPATGGGDHSSLSDAELKKKLGLP